MARVIGTQFNNYSWGDIHEMMMEFVTGAFPYDGAPAVSHRTFGPVENDREFTPGIYLVPGSGSFFGEVTADNPKVVWYLDAHKFLMDRGMIT